MLQGWSERVKRSHQAHQNPKYFQVYLSLHPDREYIDSLEPFDMDELVALVDLFTFTEPKWMIRCDHDRLFDALLLGLK